MKPYNSGIAFPKTIRIYWTDGEQSGTIHESILQAFSTYSKLTEEQFADLTLDSYKARITALWNYLNTYKYYGLKNGWLLPDTGEKIAIDSCPLSIPDTYIFEFEDSQGAEDFLDFDSGIEQFTVAVTSIKNGEHTKFSIQSKPDWLNVSIQEANQLVVISQPNISSDSRIGVVVLKQDESDNVIRLNITQEPKSTKKDVEILITADIQEAAASKMYVILTAFQNGNINDLAPVTSNIIVDVAFTYVNSQGSLSQETIRATIAIGSATGHTEVPVPSGFMGLVNREITYKTPDEDQSNCYWYSEQEKDVYLFMFSPLTSSNPTYFEYIDVADRATIPATIISTKNGVTIPISYSVDDGEDKFISVEDMQNNKDYIINASVNNSWTFRQAKILFSQVETGKQIQMYYYNNPA